MSVSRAILSHSRSSASQLLIVPARPAEQKRKRSWRRKTSLCYLAGAHISYGGDSWPRSLRWSLQQTLTSPDSSIDCQHFFCIITFSQQRREIGKLRRILICGKAVTQPFPLTNSELHLSHVINGNSRPVDNNFVMDWTQRIWPPLKGLSILIEVCEHL